MRHRFWVALIGLCLFISPSMAGEGPGTITTKASDRVLVYADVYGGGLPDTAPMILLFHQGGSNGRAEYAPLVPWLNGLGYRAIAWDQRAGGDRFGGENRTAAGISDVDPRDYCGAYPDLVAAMDYAIATYPNQKFIVWGSSYSAALVFYLGRDYPDHVAGVIGFSPAAGEPLANCRAREVIRDVTAPMMALRPRTEMGPGGTEQQSLMESAGVEYHVIEDGVHGSSMLVDERTEKDMSAARALVADWLARAFAEAE